MERPAQASVVCPHCGTCLRVDPSLAGQTLGCSHCGGSFVHASPEDGGPSGDIHGGTLVLVVVAVHILVVLGLAAWIGMTCSIVLVFLAAVVELGIWYTRRLGSLPQTPDQRDEPLRESAESSGAPQVTPVTSTQTVTAPRHEIDRPPEPTTQVSKADDCGWNAVRLPPLVEIQAKPPRPRRDDVIYATSPVRESSLPPTSPPSSYLRGSLPRGRIAFFGPGERLDLGRGVCENPLVYATADSTGGSFDASLIDGTLPVEPRGTVPAERLPYWPSYFSAAPDQRACYLDWLLGGRSDPSIQLGYVFIYFYGLERRVIIDRADYVPIAQEVIRLCSIYNHSNSFRNYSSAFLWLTILLAGRSQRLPEELILQAVGATGRWDDDILGMCLGYFGQANLPLPADVALVAVQYDHRARSSVVVRRHSEEFRELFRRRYEARFGDGLVLRASQKLRRIVYHPASGTLLRMAAAGNLDVADALGIPAISSQLKPLVTIWDECIEDLQGYHRAQRAADSETLTAEAYEALPKELRDGNHPELDAWMELWSRFADADGWPLVPAGELARIKGIPQRDRLTKTQCDRILTSAQAMGIGLEPDARLTGKCYRWTESISPFFLETDQPEDMASYGAAAALLRLGLHIAEADGHVDEEELKCIARHLESEFDLSTNQSKRLDQLKYLLLHGPTADKSIGTTLRDRLSHAHRSAVGRFLVGIAAADRVITFSEVRALKNAYRALGLQPQELDDLLSPYRIREERTEEEKATAPEAEEFRLDIEAISQIMRETEEVSKILREAMAVDEEEQNLEPFTPSPASQPAEFGQLETQSCSATATLDEGEEAPAQDGTPESNQFSTLSPRFQPFLRALLSQREWSQTAATALAGQHSLMLAGAIEAINEWSCEQLGDWLVQEGNPLTIQLDLLEG